MKDLPEDLLRLLLLYDSGELASGEKERLEKALSESPALRAELETLRAFLRDLRQSPSFDPSAELMSGVRHDLRVQLRRERLRPTWGERLEAWAFDVRPAWQLAAAAALVVIGMFLDRMMFSAPRGMNAAELLQQFAAAQPVAAENGSVSPLMAGVEYIRIDPQTDQVELHFNLVNDIQLRGSADDPTIRRVLAFALTQNDRPNVRLKAVKALAEKPVADDDVISALVNVMQNDDNEGIRLKAAQVLRNAPLNDKIKSALSWVLLRDRNAAVRMEALEALGNASLNENEMAALHAASADSNDYVRLQAKRLIERRDNPQVPAGEARKPSRQ